MFLRITKLQQNTNPNTKRKRPHNNCSANSVNCKLTYFLTGSVPVQMQNSYIRDVRWIEIRYDKPRWI